MFFMCQWCARRTKTWGFEWPAGWLTATLKMWGKKDQAVVCSEACKIKLEAQPERRRVMWH